MSKKKIRINLDTETIDRKSPTCNNGGCTRPNTRTARVTTQGKDYDVGLCDLCALALAKHDRKRKQEIARNAMEKIEDYEFDPKVVAEAVGRPYRKPDVLSPVSPGSSAYGSILMRKKCNTPRF